MARRPLTVLALAAAIVLLLSSLRPAGPGPRPPAAGARSLPLRGLAVVMDPGHGGIDSGAVAAGVQEKGVNLAIALAAARELRDFGARVVLTRHTDQAPVPRGERRYLRDRRRRAELVAETGAQLFVSVHANYVGGSGPRGPLVLWNPSANAGSRALAGAIRTSLQGALGVRVRMAPQAVLILQWARVPAVTIEAGFLSNPVERAALVRPAYQARVGTAIAVGVRSYWTARRAQDTFWRGLAWAGA